MSQTIQQHPLNQAIVSQVLHDIRNGQTRKVLAMGFSEEDLKVFKDPQCLSALINSPVNWAGVAINRLVIKRVISQVARDEQQDRMIDRALKLGASSALMAELFGLTHKEVALRRTVMGMPPKKGRWPTITEQQELELWERWQRLVKHNPIQHSDDIAVLDLVMLLVEEQSGGTAESYGPPLTAIWSTVKQWIGRGVLV